MSRKETEEDFKAETDRVLNTITEAAQGVNEWLSNTNCADMDVSEFFTEKNNGTPEHILKACLGCTVRKECIEMIGTFEKQDGRPGKGIFAGLSGNARGTYILPYPKEEWEERSEQYIKKKLLVRSKDYQNELRKIQRKKLRERAKNATL